MTLLTLYLSTHASNTRFLVGQKNLSCSSYHSHICLTAGGFKGCGHSHKGHPGKLHWSCCGSTVKHSECLPQTVLDAVSPHGHLRTAEL